MAAVRRPKAPSAKSLSPPLRSQPSPSPGRKPTPRACSNSAIATWLTARSRNRPRVRRRWKQVKPWRPSRSWMAVKPRRWTILCACKTAASRSASVGSGIRSLTRSIAGLSNNNPVSAPEASRTSSPPGGLGVFSSSPARARAGELATAAWPLLAQRMVGCSGEKESRSWRVGNCPPGHRD